MPSRIIREGIITSTRVNALSPGAEIFYRRLINVVDDYGRYHGAPATLRGACWPRTPEKCSDVEIEQWLSECCSGSDPLVIRYVVDGGRYVEISNFGQKIRTKSKFPAPDGSAIAGGIGNVYFIFAKTSKRIKIGFTELAPKARLATLQTGSAEALELLGSFPGTMSDEKESHLQFADNRLIGEWFTDCAEIRQLIAAKCGQLPQKTGTSRIANFVLRISEAYTPPPQPQAENTKPSIERDHESDFTRLYARHPQAKRKARGLAMTMYQQAVQGGADPDVIAAIHTAMCHTESWRWKSGAQAPTLAEWIVDRGWEHPPDGSVIELVNKPDARTPVEQMADLRRNAIEFGASEAEADELVEQQRRLMNPECRAASP
jgi:Meiotically Up-regulated Gene 113 (MUG113) protein